MKKIFLSFSFRDQDRELVGWLDQLLRSHDIVPVTGKRLGGEALTPTIMNRIEQCDGLIALLTRRDELAGGGWTTHPWVRDELNHARGAGLRTIALIENGVQTGGAHGENEWIPLDREAPMDAILALSDTVGLWKRERGRQLKIQILPETLAQQAAQAAGEMTCHYRFVIEGDYTEWREARQVREVAGTFVYLTGVQDDYLIQIRVQHGNTEWRSVAASQWVPIELQQQGGGQ